MNNFKVLVLFLIVGLLGCGNERVETPVTNYITDDLQNKIEIGKVPQRIVTLAPNLTELVFELGEGNKLVGNTNFCNFPDSAKAVTNVADLLSVNLELISDLKPDIIFITAEGNSKSEYIKLKDLGFKVFVSNPRHYNGIKKTMLDLGRIFRKENKSSSIVEAWDNKIEEIKNQHDKVILNSVLFLISTKPIISVGKKSFIHQILTYAGLKNITSDSDVSYPLFSREDILLKNPDYIILYETNTNDVDDLLNIYPEWHTLAAVVNKRVLFINADLYSRPGPRFIEAVEDLFKKVTAE
jgi:iron complex transport system substrate-binding protein